MIRLDNITKIYRTKEIETLALDRIDFEVKKGEFVSVMGPSGCGKTTLLNIIVGAVKPDTGHIFIDGDDIDPISIGAAFSFGWPIGLKMSIRPYEAIIP